MQELISSTERKKINENRSVHPQIPPTTKIKKFRISFHTNNY
jgi:hypothetical protein